MKVVRSRTLTHDTMQLDTYVRPCRNEGRPFKDIDTGLQYLVLILPDFVEMKVVRSRTLTHQIIINRFKMHIFCRNEGRPFKDIDTNGLIAAFLVFET